MSGELNLPLFLMHALDALSLPSNTEVVRKADGKWVAKRHNEDPVLHNLGPFGVKKAGVYLCFYSASEPGMYRVDFRNRLRILEEWGIPPSGCHGPIAPITWSDEDKAKFNIPTEATRFCWCYPPPLISDLQTHQKERLDTYIKAQDPEFTFLAFGGFVYFSELPDGTLKMARALALMQGGMGISFGAPITWRAEFTSDLYKQSRFQPVTIQALKDMGIHQFCYINPNEQLRSDDGVTTWIPSPHGGFVYLYTNNSSEPHHLDRFFPQSPTILNPLSPTITPSTSPTSSSPLSRSSGSIPFSMITRRSPNFESSCININNNNNNYGISTINCSSPPSTIGSLPYTPSAPIAINRGGYPQTPTSPTTPTLTPSTTPTAPTPTPKLTPSTTPTTTPSSPGTCAICLENPSRVLMIPCRHLCACSECATHLKELCPMCRQEIKDKWHVFL